MKESSGIPGPSSLTGSGVRLPAHTPGPWHIKPGDLPGFKTHSGGAGIYAAPRPEDDYFILQIAAIETNVRAAEAEANALLIIAAPELLASLQEMVGWYGKREGALTANDALLPPDEQEHEVRRAMAAIAKALGPPAPDTSDRQRNPGMEESS